MQQKGFTLIELIIVIVILGILAVTAAPRFLDLSSDAKASTLDGVKAALQSGAQLVYAKSAIAGVQNTVGNSANDPVVEVSGNNVATNYGYPNASFVADTGTDNNVSNWLQLDLANDFVLTVGSGATDTPPAGSFGIAPGTAEPDYSTDTCHVIYTNSTGAASAPVVTVVSSGC